ncbi:MAG: hypothetical protein HC905_14085, partial [Bacteroidales bacterium]|nr:hypothetical protein [Bacteroidales bacterium]
MSGKKYRQKLLGVMLMTLFVISQNLAFAQIYPVSTVTSVMPPYPTSLEGFADQAASKISLQIVVNDVTLTNHPVKLRMVMKSANTHISTSSTLVSQPIYIHGGETMVLSAVDLATYFRPEHLDFSGFSKSQYLRTGLLPDGIYQISFEVLDYQRSFVISSAIPAFLYLFVNEPPVLNTPQPARQIDITGQQNIVFNWSFRHSPFTSPGFQPEYQLDIWEIYPENLDPYAVVRSSQPVFSERTRQTSFHYTYMHPQLIPGRKYAWRVRAMDPQSIAAFKENGYSEVRWFKYGTACDAPVLKAGKAGTTHLNVEWETPQLQKDFSIRYRPEQPQDAPWYTAKTSFLSHKLENLRPNTAYIVEVSGKCNSQESPASNRVTLRTNLDLNFQCGAKGNIPRIENQTPIPHLQKGNFIKAGDFEVEVYHVQGVNGVFNGKGYVLVPLFNFIKLDAVLENVQVNSDFQLIGGSIRTIYDVNNSAMINATDVVNSIQSDTKPETNDFAGMDVVKINAGDSITSITIANNEVTVRTSDGEKITERIDSARIIAVTAPSGHQYVVDGATKTVYTSSSPGGEAPKADRLNTTESSKYHVEFASHPGQSYGFDSVPANPEGRWYETKTIGDKQVYLPWKSVENGRYDKLVARIEGSPADSVFFSRKSASMVMAAPGSTKSEKQLMITG